MLHDSKMKVPVAPLQPLDLKIVPGADYAFI